MKPTKMRNAQIWQATNGRRSRQLGSLLSKDLRAKYGRRSIRVSAGDTVRVMRGEYKDVDGKVAMVDTAKSGVAIEGIKREKGKGDKVDIIIHASNILVTGINTQDKWRTSRLSGSKGVRSIPAKAGAAAGQAEKPAKEAAGHSEKPAKAADAGQAEKPAKEAAGHSEKPAKAADAGQAEKPAKEAAGHSEKPAKAADAGQAEKPAKEAAGHSEKPAKAADAGQAEKPAKGEAAE